MLLKMGGGMLLKNQAFKWGNGLEKLHYGGKCKPPKRGVAIGFV
jgi:hypothetical protein